MTTLIIPIISDDGGLIASLWEIGEGGTEFLHTIKIVPPKGLGSIDHPDTMH